MLRKLPITLQIAILLLSMLLLILHTGFEYGIVNPVFIISGENVHEFITRCYISICVWILIFMMSKLIRKEIVSHIICFSSLFFIILTYKLVYAEKNLLFQNAETINDFLRLTLPLDVLNFSLVIVLLIVQVFCLYRRFTLRTKKMV